MENLLQNAYVLEQAEHGFTETALKITQLS